MRMLADDNLALADTLFGHLGELRCLPGREIDHAQARQADALLLRSVTRVDQALLENTPVRFVGTATIGTDHIDLGALKRFGIAFASAPGCNAEAVADYVVAAVLAWCERCVRDPTALSIGIVGLGHVGQAVQRRFDRLGCAVLAYDPPRAERGEVASSDLDRILACDVVTLHVPLSREGKHATQRLIGAGELAELRRGQCLINAARGGVVDETALKQRLGQADPPDVIIDTWENEPAIDNELLAACFLGTPHIAGYSQEGRIRGSWVVYQALCRHLLIEPRIGIEPMLPDPVVLHPAGAQPIEIVRAAYDIHADDKHLRREVAQPRGFDKLRRSYTMRREFSSLRLSEPDAVALALGFSSA